MSTVRRVFRMIALEGASLYRVKKTLELVGLTPPKGGRYWSKKTLRDMTLLAVGVGGEHGLSHQIQC
jgi:hypothetical protein